MVRKIRYFASLLLLSFIAMFMASGIRSDAAMSDTKKSMIVTAVGRAHNWDGISNVAQFKGPDGRLFYAIDSDGFVTVYKTRGGMPTSENAVNLKKVHPLYGTLTCDTDGNFYLVTGEADSSSTPSMITMFVSKYDRNGNLLRTVGCSGDGSTRVPFEAGNCDAAINGRLLTVIYSRTMYNNHQSNNVIWVNIDSMEIVRLGNIYESHSFAERVVATSDGFLYMSEGDCFDRAFTSYYIDQIHDEYPFIHRSNIFDFWVRDGAYDDYDMADLNENFAHMGGLALLPDEKIVFAAQSARSLNDGAKSEKEDIFIQIFDPKKDLNTVEAYTTTGIRSGLSGPNGRTNVTNYGVKWLTSIESDEEISDVQIVATKDGESVILYQMTKGGIYMGIYYIVLDEDGNVKRSGLYNADAMLNPCVMPVYSEGKICWLGNKYEPINVDKRVFIYSLDPDSTQSLLLEAPKAVTGLVYEDYSSFLENDIFKDLIIPGLAEGGRLYYAVTKDKNAPQPDAYSSFIPRESDAGTYYVWYRIKGDENHNDTEASCIEVVIEKGQSEVIDKPTVYFDTLEYTCSPLELVNEGRAYNGTMNYAVTTDSRKPSDSAFKEDIPKAAKEGTYYVWFKSKGDENHADSPAEYLVVSIVNYDNKGSKTECPKAAGTRIKDTGTAGNYVVTSSGEGTPTVRYTGSSKKNVTSITISPTITYKGITYKVTEVGPKALKGNKKLRKVKLGKNIKKIGSEAFSGCSALTSIELDANLLSVGSRAFYSCSSLKKLTLPVKTNKLGKQFVAKCKRLGNLSIKSRKMTAKTVDRDAFAGMNNKSSVTVTTPKAVKSKYATLFRNRGLGKKIKIKSAK